MNVLHIVSSGMFPLLALSLVADFAQLVDYMGGNVVSGYVDDGGRLSPFAGCLHVGYCLGANCLRWHIFWAAYCIWASCFGAN